MTRGKLTANNETRECTRCGAQHTRKHTWCTPCWSAWRKHEAEAQQYVRPTARPGKPPPPPAGFDMRDLERGKPIA